MPLVVHIGYHKTGSTALQHWLSDRRDALAAGGLLFPAGLSKWLGHPEIAWTFAGNGYGWQDRRYTREEVEAHYRPLLEASLDPDTLVVLSSEEFCRLDFEFAAMRALHEWLAPYRPRIMGFFRTPFAFLLSRYRHEVQSGWERRPLRDFLNDIDNVQSANFHMRTLVWESCYGGDCIFRNYENGAADTGIVGAFLAAVDRADLLTDEAARPAEGDDEFKLHPSLIETIRQVAASDLAGDERKRLFQSIFALSRTLPAISMTGYARNLGLTEDTYRLLGSLRTDTINDTRSLATLGA